jgi:hypothetical protein
MVAFGHGVAALGIGVTLVGPSGGMWQQSSVRDFIF